MGCIELMFDNPRHAGTLPQHQRQVPYHRAVLTANQGRNPGGRVVIKHEWITAYFCGNASTGGEELGAQGEAVLSRWVRESVRPSVAPGRPLSREELVVELDRIESGLGDR